MAGQEMLPQLWMLTRYIQPERGLGSLASAPSKEKFRAAKTYGWMPRLASLTACCHSASGMPGPKVLLSESGLAESVQMVPAVRQVWVMSAHESRKNRSVRVDSVSNTGALHLCSSFVFCRTLVCADIFPLARSCFLSGPFLRATRH